jgi:hypothetical protein
MLVCVMLNVVSPSARKLGVLWNLDDIFRFRLTLRTKLPKWSFSMPNPKILDKAVLACQGANTPA